MYLTRDADNTLSLHKDFPNKLNVSGYEAFWSNDMIELDEDLYPEVTTYVSPVKVSISIDG